MLFELLLIIADCLFYFFQAFGFVLEQVYDILTIVFMIVQILTSQFVPPHLWKQILIRSSVSLF